MTNEPIDPETRKVSVPVFPQLGKGWNAKDFASSDALLRHSSIFLKRIEKREWTAVMECLHYRIDFDLQDDKGECALHKVIMCQHEGLTRFLMEQDANLEISDDFGFNALHHAVFFDDLRLVECLLFRSVNVHRITKDGYNALHFCAARGNLTIAKMLVDRNIDFTCKSKNNQTPLDFAKQYGHQDLADFLEMQIQMQQQALQKHMDELRKEAFSNNNIYRPPVRHHFQRGPNRVIFSDDEKDSWSEENDIHNITTECNNCGVLEDSDLTYCTECGFVLGDECPDCGETELDKMAYCKTCFKALWSFNDKTAQQSAYKICPFCNAEQDDDNATFCCSCYNSLVTETKKRKKTTTTRFFSECPSCNMNQAEEHDFCTDCGYGKRNFSSRSFSHHR